MYDKILFINLLEKNKMLPLETLIDNKKLTNAKNEFYELLSKKHYQDGLNNFLKHHNARVKFFQKFRFLKWIALLVSILTALFYPIFNYLDYRKATSTSVFGIFCIIFGCFACLWVCIYQV